MKASHTLFWFVFLFYGLICSLAWPQLPRQATQDEISRLIELAAVPHQPPILFGDEFAVFGSSEMRHLQHADRVARIMHRLSPEKRKQGLATAIQKLIQIGEPALFQIHEKVKSASLNDPALPQLVDALGFIGNDQSIEILINKYQLADDSVKLMDAPGIEKKADHIGINKLEQKCILAIWSLTGRRHAFKPARWKSWWTKTRPYYLTRKKSSTTFDKILFEKAIQQFSLSPEKEEAIVARDQIIILGRAILPELHRLLKKSQQDRVPRKKASSEKTTIADHVAFNLCWCIDELGESAKLPRETRLDYFIDRFSIQHKFLLPPNEKDARLRALFHCSLADFCSLAIAVDGKGGDRINSISFHFYVLFAPFRMKYLAYTKDNYGVMPNGFAEQHRRYGYVAGLSREQVIREVEQAVPILVKAIEGNNTNKAYTAARLSDMIGMVSPEAPQKLVEALRNQWLKNGDNSNAFGSAMVRFDSPIVTEALRKGLFSQHESIVRTSANNANNKRFPPDSNPEVYRRLVELLDHPSPRMRFATIRTLRGAKPTLLKPHLHRLAKDPSDDVVVEVCYAIDKLENPMFAEILVEIAMDENRKTQVRSTAIDRLGEKHFDSRVDEIKPLLADKKLHGYALNAFFEAKGKKSLPILMDFIKKNPGNASMATQYLPRLTGLKFKTADQWLEWWRKQLQ